jgi:hypothetical protein
MAIFIGIAAAWDCVRLAGDVRHRVELADAELRKHEERFMALVTGSPDLTPEVEAAVAIYRGAESMQERHAAYAAVVATFRKTMSRQADPTHPLDRKFMDDAAGAVNRREVAEKAYSEEIAAYREFVKSFRGRVARRFSSTCCTL